MGRGNGRGKHFDAHYSSLDRGQPHGLALEHCSAGKRESEYFCSALAERFESWLLVRVWVAPTARLVALEKAASPMGHRINNRSSGRAAGRPLERYDWKRSPADVCRNGTSALPVGST